MARSLDRRGRNRGLTARGGRPPGGFRETFLQECRSQAGGVLFPLAAATLFLLAFLGMANAPLAIVSAQHVLAIPAAFWSVALVATAMARVPCTQSADRRRLPLLFGRVAGGALAAFLCSCAALLGTLAGAAAPWLDPARLGPFSLEPYWQALWTVAAPNAFIACGLACVVAVHVRGVYPACAAALVLLSLVASAGVVADPDTLAWLDPSGTVAFLQARPGAFLANRLAWLGVALVSLVVAGWRFRLRTGPASTVRLLSLSSAALVVAAWVYLVVWTGRLADGGVLPALPWGDLVAGVDANPLLPVQLAVIALAGALVYPGRGIRRDVSIGTRAGVFCCIASGLWVLGGVGGLVFAWVVSDGAGGPALRHVTLYAVLGWELVVLAGVAVAVHALAGNRLRGTLAMLLVLLWDACAAGLGFEHVLYRPGLPETPDSQVAVGAYWSAFAVLLALVAHALGPTSVGAGWRAWLAIAGVVWVGLGVWIFYNTNVRNAYETAADVAAYRAEYERRFGHYAALPAPRVLALDLVVDLHPERRAVRSRGTMLLGNTGAAPVTGFIVSFPRRARVEALSIPATLVERADALGARRYVFDPPLRPTERVRMTFDVTGERAAYPRPGSSIGSEEDGMFVAARDILPFPGYDASVEPADSRLRLRVRLGTRLDHEGVAPGRLVRAWRENDRGYFEYEADGLAWARLAFGSRRPCGHAHGARVESGGGSRVGGGGGAQALGSCDGAVRRRHGFGGGEERVVR